MGLTELVKAKNSKEAPLGWLIPALVFTIAGSIFVFSVYYSRFNGSYKDFMMFINTFD